MTTIKRNAGGDVSLELRFYGPPGADGALGAAFDLTGWQLAFFNSDYQVVTASTFSVDSAPNGEARLLIDAATISMGTYPFRFQLVNGSGFRVGFPSARLQLGDFTPEELDGQSPHLLLSGKNGVQVTIAPAEPDLIFGGAPGVLHNGVPVTHNNQPVVHTV